MILLRFEILMNHNFQFMLMQIINPFAKHDSGCCYQQYTQHQIFLSYFTQEIISKESFLQMVPCLSALCNFFVLLFPLLFLSAKHTIMHMIMSTHQLVIVTNAHCICVMKMMASNLQICTNKLNILHVLDGQLKFGMIIVCLQKI